VSLGARQRRLLPAGLALGAVAWLGVTFLDLACSVLGAFGGSHVAPICSAIPWKREAPSGPSAERSVDDGVIYAALLDTIYHPADHTSMRFPLGVVVVQETTVRGDEYGVDLSRTADSVRQALPAEGDRLLRAFAEANRIVRRPAAVAGRYDEVYMDSAEVESLLGSAPGESMIPGVAVASGHWTQGGPGGVFALSQVGTLPDASAALVFAVLRTRESLAPRHLAAASFFVLRREGWRWKLWREFSAPLTRGER